MSVCVCVCVCLSDACCVCLSVLTLWVYACHAGSSRQRLSKALRVLCCLSGFTVVPSARLAGLACPLSCLPDSGSSVLGFVWRSGALHTAVDTTQRQSKSHSPPLSSPPHTHTNTLRTWSQSSLMKEGKMWGVNRGYSDSTSRVPGALLLSLLDGCLRIERAPVCMKVSDSDLFNGLNSFYILARLGGVEECLGQLLQRVDKHGEAARCYVSTVKTIQSVFNSPNSRETGLWLHFGWYTLPFGFDSALLVTLQVVFLFQSLLVLFRSLSLSLPTVRLNLSLKVLFC